MKKAQNVLVTGGAGYLGAVLVRKLLEENYKVTVVDPLFFGSSPLNKIKKDKRLSVHKMDIRNEAGVLKLLEKNEYLIHLGALVGDWVCNKNPQQAVEINYLATKSLIKNAKKTGIKKFVFASTCSVYGFSNKLLTENDMPNPVSVYGMTKVLAEQYLLSQAAKRFCTTVLRMATLYGWAPRMRFDLVANQFAAQATLGDRITLYAGYQWRPFIHVQDAASAFMLVLKTQNERINGQIFNVCDNTQNIQIYKLAEIVKKAIPGSKVFRDEKITEQRNYIVSGKKIKKLLNFNVSMNLLAGVREMRGEILKSKQYEDYKNAIFTSSINLNDGRE